MLRKCALFLAIPVSRSALEQALERSDGTDFAAQVHRAARWSTFEQTWKVYQPLAQLAGTVIDEARAAGVTVVADATLESWSGALSRFHTVTVVAHWRSSVIEPADIVDHDALLAAIADTQSPPWRALRGFDPQLQTPRTYDVAALARWMTAAIDHSDGSDSTLSADARLVEREYRRYRRRPELQRAAPGIFRGEAAVEFSGGFQPVREILRHVDPAIGCAVDLTVCNSVLLGEEIRRRCRRALVLVNANPATPAFRLALYRQVVHLLKTGGRSYPETMMQLRQHLVDSRAAAS